MIRAAVLKWLPEKLARVASIAIIRGADPALDGALAGGVRHNYTGHGPRTSESASAANQSSSFQPTDQSASRIVIDSDY